MALRSRDLWQSLVGAVALAIAAQIKMTMPGSPVPVTGQTWALALIAGWGGTRTALGAVVLYVFAAAVGVGVLSGGRGGWSAISGPSAGYLVGFAVAAVVMPTLLRRWGRRRWLFIWLAIEAGSACILGLGAAGLVLRGASWSAAWSNGVAPFLPGDLLKSVAAATLLRWGPAIAGVRPRRVASRRSR